MARCFPYPPPSFVGKDKAYDQALIESIKLQKEREKVRAEKKERKREKKERAEKKEKQKQAGKRVGNDEKTHQGQKNITDSRKKDIRKGKEVDQLERSDISEEHGPPYYSQNLCYSSDSTQNGESLRSTLPSDGSCSLGNILRIRLKRKEPDASPREEQVCSTSGQHDVSIRQIHEIAHHPIHNVQFQLRLNEPGALMRVKRPCFTSWQSDICAEQKHGIAQRANENAPCSAVVSGVSSKGLASASPRVEQPCFTSGWNDIHAEEKYGIALSPGQDPSCSPWQSDVRAEQKHGIAQRPNQNPPCSAVVSGVSSKGLTSASLRVEQPCFTSGWTHAEKEYGNAHRPGQGPPCSAVGTGVSSRELASKYEKGQHRSIAANAEAASETVSKMEGPESLYQALIENWVPPKLQFERTDSDDLEWLFDPKHQKSERAKVAQVGEECVSTGCAATWPCACFLPGADIHVLPFTVPF